MNAGTSGRTAFCSVGNLDYQSAREANMLASRNLGQSTPCFGVSRRLAIRTVCLMLLVVCLNGCFTLEQPGSSFFQYYPRWRELRSALQGIGGADAVPSHATLK